MSPKLRVVKLLNFIENFFCIYRNCSSFKNCAKYFVIFRIFVECVMLFLFLPFMVNTNIKHFVPSDSLILFTFILSYLFVLMLNSIVAIILGFFYSNQYTELVSNIAAIHTLCKHDLTYNNIVKKQNKKFYIHITIFFTFLSSLFIVFLRDEWSKLVSLSMKIIYLILVTSEYRFYLEHLVFYELNDIIVVLLEYLNESIASSVNKLSSDEDIESGELCETRGEVARCAAVSGRLAAACDQLRNCFGAQISLLLSTSMLYYILLLYQLTIYWVNQELMYVGSSWSFMLSLAMYMSANALVTAGGQRVRNEAHTLDIKLAELHIRLVEMPGGEAAGCARVVRALARRLRTSPVRVRLLTRSVRAALLLDVLAFVLNYTVILLQFNHVV